MNRFLTICIFFILISSNAFGANDKEGPIRIGDRFQIYNQLTSIFGDSAKEILEKYIIQYPHYFGGRCDLYEAVFKQNNENSGPTGGNFNILNPIFYCFQESDLTANAFTTISSPREGLIIQACTDLLYEGGSPKSGESDEAFNHAKGKICSDADSVCSFNNYVVKKAYNLFFPYYELSEDNATGLKDTIEIDSGDSDDSLRALLYALCQDPNWQAF